MAPGDGVLPDPGRDRLLLGLGREEVQVPRRGRGQLQLRVPPAEPGGRAHSLQEPAQPLDPPVKHTALPPWAPGNLPDPHR